MGPHVCVWDISDGVPFLSSTDHFLLMTAKETFQVIIVLTELFCKVLEIYAMYSIVTVNRDCTLPL